MSPSSDWSRDESRYLDGELEATAAGRLERALERDPARRDRLHAWTEAMDIWRDDVSRRADSIPAPALAHAVVAGLRRSSSAAVAAEPVLRRYAAAAALLIGLGTAGAAWLGPDAGLAPRLRGPDALRLLEAGQLGLHERLALTTFPQPAAMRPETER